MSAFDSWRERAERAAAFLVLIGLGVVGASCSGRPQVIASVPAAGLASPAMLEGHPSVPLDTAPKEDLRLVPAEVYMRTYLDWFGGLAPIEVQQRARGTDGGGLFDTWDDYLSSLGLPDYRSDLPRVGQTNALMIAAFERLGVALCDRAIEHDIHPRPVPQGKGTATGGARVAPGPQLPPPIDQRLVFAFDVPKGPMANVPLDLPGFTSRFDVLHRTFLGYPAALAKTDRVERFYELYRDTVTRHAMAIGDKSAPKRLTPAEAGWATVCYGLIRHPELHLY